MKNIMSDKKMPQDSTRRPLRTIKSFVLRSGRMTEAQTRAMAEHQQRYGLSVADGLLEPQTIFSRTAPLVLEIGFGMGQSLVAQAQLFPEQDFIGIEVHRPGIGKLFQMTDELKLPNIRAYNHDAVEVLEKCIADNSLDRVQIFFPDPWHKKKHHKRRLIQPAFVQQLRKKLKPGGIIHVATDWHDYAEHIMEVMELAEGFHNQSGEYAFSEKPDSRPLTKFEQRGKNLGHGVWDILFVKDA
jgi:tRNA (guanine-N7-)-methyltransferase